MMVDELKQIFEDNIRFLETQWYRRTDALKYMLEDLQNALVKAGKYDDEFTAEEMKAYTECEKEYKDLVEEYEVGELYCLKAM